MSDIKFRASSTEIDRLPVKAVKSIIDESWWAFLRVCEGSYYRELHECVEQEEKAEKRHRSNRTRFALSCNYAARLFVLQHVLAVPTEAPKTWRGAASMAPRVLAAYGLGDRMRTDKLGRNIIPIFDGETYMVRAVAAINQRTGRLAELDGSAERRLIQKRGIACGYSLHLPAVMGVDYAEDIARST